MTITCEDCDTAGFRNAFTPNPDTKRAVILVHGMFGTYRVWDNFINTYRTTNQPYQLWTFSYLVSKPVEENAKELANYLEINSFRYNKIDIVGYSLGGLVAQAALRYAYEENQKNANRYTFIHKVDKAILVASPSKGSPVAVEFESYITEFINDRATDYVPMNPLTLQALKEGVSVPRVPGVDYLAIAGIRSYDFLKRTGLTDRMFGEELNDGLVGVSSAQYIGDAVLDNKCVNFWERDQDHTHLIIEKNTQDLIAQMLSSRIKDALEELDRTTTLAGYTNYYEFTIDRCSPEDVYIVIGKPVAEDQIERDLLCGCGDGICAGFESAENCPTDCTHIPATVWASLAILLIILFIPFYIRLKDYLLLFVKMVKKGLAEGKTLKQIKSELEEFGYDRSILRMADKVEKLKDYDEFKIRDLLSMELTREEMKKFSGFTIIGHWVTHSLLKKPIGGREVEEAEKAFTKERKTKAAEKEPETAGEKKEETKKEEGTAEEKKEAQKGQEKTTEEKKTPEEPEQKPPAGEGKEEAKEPEVPKPKKQIIKKAVDKIAGRKSPEDLMKELERVDKDLTEAKEENEKVGFEALF
ncbi:TPA: alpha/beta hydrolase [Candidatus Woesearchaeota archaeon]|nr:alpha/beta hydrolase [Candidatus Woesearchaeota archaeon]